MKPLYELPTGKSDTPGFRLHKVELWNWGTFDEQIFTIRPSGKSALLIGRNGSGKSTLVDALLTLLVRPGVRNFNVAAGAKKRERDERSYLLGAYDRGSDEEGQGIRIKYLRPKGERYSVILACFRNLDTDKTFTVAQVLYLASDQSVDKVYCFSEDERSIQKDFTGLESSDGMMKALKNRDIRATRTFQDFESWFNKAARVKSKAMEVFNQTVAVKDIQRLNDFIRDHMLEPHDWGEKVDRLLGHFTLLSEAHDSLVRVRQQRDLLEPIARIGTEFQQHSQALVKAERLWSASAAYFSQKIVDLFGPALELKQQELAQTSARKERLATEIRTVQEQVRSLKNEIESVGGDRLKQIPHLIEIERAHAARKRLTDGRYRESLSRLSIAEAVDGPVSFATLQTRIPALLVELKIELTRRGGERDEATLNRAQVRQQLSALRVEFEGLNRRKDNVPEWCVQLRQTVCQELGLPIRDFPFAAELMQVVSASRDWEASIEKVLRGLALSMLVPDKYGPLLARHLDRTRLIAQGRGQRLVYLRVADQASPRGGASSGSQALYSKLEFRQNHPLVPWLKAEVLGRFDYTCCESVDEFQESRGPAMTRQRHIKNDRHRHEKDDREQVSDPRNFVLGWDNQEKKRRITAEIESLSTGETRESARLETIEGRLSQLRDQLAAAVELQRVATFAEIDYAAHEQEITTLEEERRAIENNSDTLRTLKRRLTETETRERAMHAQHEQLIGDERELKTQIANAKRLLANAEADLARRTADGSLDSALEVFSELDQEFEDLPLSTENLFDRKDRFGIDQSERLKQLRTVIEPVRSRLTDAMSKFLRHSPEESNDLHASAEYLESFLSLRQHILEDDLPRHEQRFKQRLNQRVIQEIGLFQSALQQERRKIEDKIELLNISLKKLEYRPGTHIQLEPRQIRDVDIAGFQGRLRECVDGSFEETAEANEAQFKKIQELIARLRDDESRKWRDKVVDVRRWFDFVAVVIDRETEKSVSVYQDSSGQSGGEKAKLAFTILVAAIAYQYDLDPENPVSDRFHFVVVDEMFSKVDDQHAQYALNLFRQFGLQLLIVAPLDAKARVTQPYVGSYLHVVKKENRSAIFEMTAREFEQCALENDSDVELAVTQET